MPLRIGFDMDGVVADFSAAFYDVEERLFGPGHGVTAGEPEKEEQAQTAEPETSEEAASRQQAPVTAEEGRSVREARRRRDAIWRAIQSTSDFWMTLAPTDPTAVR